MADNEEELLLDWYRESDAAQKVFIAALIKENDELKANVREVIPGTVTISREEFRKAFMDSEEKWLGPTKYSLMEQLEVELFGPETKS